VGFQDTRHRQKAQAIKLELPFEAASLYFKADGSVLRAIASNTL
jgi:hypothetical protein